MDAIGALLGDVSPPATRALFADGEPRVPSEALPLAFIIQGQLCCEKVRDDDDRDKAAMGEADAASLAIDLLLAGAADALDDDEAPSSLRQQSNEQSVPQHASFAPIVPVSAAQPSSSSPSSISPPFSDGGAGGQSGGRVSGDEDDLAEERRPYRSRRCASRTSERRRSARVGGFGSVGFSSICFFLHTSGLETGVVGFSFGKRPVYGDTGGALERRRVNSPFVPKSRNPGNSRLSREVP